MSEQFNQILDLALTTGTAQLVQHLDDAPKGKIKGNYLIQPKYDGVYCAIVVGEVVRGEPREVAFLSRQGKPLFVPDEVAERVLKELMADSYESPIVIITELIFDGSDLGEIAGRVSPNRKEPWEPWWVNDITFYAHDVIYGDEFLRGFSPRPYRDRYKTLCYYVPPVRAGQATLKRVPIVSSLDGASQYDNFKSVADDFIEAGWEGIVAKHDNGSWMVGRRNYLVVKVVRGIHVDLPCTDVVWGKGKREGRIGALVFSYKGKTFRADLGKGWDDLSRELMTKRYIDECEYGYDNPYPIGTTFHIKGLQESAKGVIRLPKVQEERFDK